MLVERRTRGALALLLLTPLYASTSLATPKRPATLTVPIAAFASTSSLDNGVWVKLREDAPVGWDTAAGTTQAPGSTTESETLRTLLAGSTVHARFSRPAAELREDSKRWDPTQQLADLTRYARLEGAEAQLEGLRAHPWVESVVPVAKPAPPSANTASVDLPPETPDYTSHQSYFGAAPDGFGVDDALRWTDAAGAGVQIADIEYGWEPRHEDLPSAPLDVASGDNMQLFVAHGTSVLGVLIAGVNGYGVDGLVPNAEVSIVSPYDGTGFYDVADAIDRAAALLEPGSILLIEQQTEAFGNYAPVEADPGVFDAITLAVSKGIVVIEPAGNGACDLDDTQWEGLFDRSQRDSGAILVGGGASPASGYVARDWYPDGSCYGERVDVQGWYDAITTTTTGEFGDHVADLFFPHHDDRQAYTTLFGGSSGAAAQIAGLAALVQSVAISRHTDPLAPETLRNLFVRTGTPQAGDGSERIGPQPNVSRLFRVWFTP